mgnify:CR=1 FL=1
MTAAEGASRMGAIPDTLMNLGFSGADDPFGEDVEGMWHPALRRKRQERFIERRDAVLRRAGGGTATGSSMAAPASASTLGSKLLALSHVSEKPHATTGGRAGPAPLSGVGLAAFPVCDDTDDRGDDARGDATDFHSLMRRDVLDSKRARDETGAASNLTYAEFMSSNNQRVPRRGEIGVSAEDIQSYENLGYVMSGASNRHFEKGIEGLQRVLHHRQAEKVRLDIISEEHRRRDDSAVEDFKRILAQA